MRSHLDLGYPSTRWCYAIKLKLAHHLAVLHGLVARLDDDDIEGSGVRRA